MSQYNGMVLTAAGLQLETKAQAGTAIKFTRVVLGDGQLPQGQILSALTNLVSPKLELPIISIDVTGTGTARMQTALQNKDLTAGFFSREIGVFADDPDSGEILYSVANAGDMADYIPAGGGADVVELILEVITVIGQAATVTANINTSLLFATQTDLEDHKNSANPHVNLLQWGPAVTDLKNVIVQQADGRTINPISFDNFRQKVLGGDGTDISIMRGRLEQVEREQSNIALSLEAEKIFPDYNAMLVEDFVNPDMVDTFSCDVTSIVAGDDSIDVSSLKGVVLGAWYTLTDGVLQETAQVKSVIKNGSTFRLIMTAPIQNTYVTGSTLMFRTTADIQTGAGQAEGAGNQKSTIWLPTMIWAGIGANIAVSTALNTTQNNATAFTLTGSMGFTADGAVTLL